MATITIRNLDEKVKRKLQVRAALNGRSMEAEVRACLALLAEEDTPSAGAEEDLGTAIRRLFAPLGVVELKIPPAPNPLGKFLHLIEISELSRTSPMPSAPPAPATSPVP